MSKIKPLWFIDGMPRYVIAEDKELYRLPIPVDSESLHEHFMVGSIQGLKPKPKVTVDGPDGVKDGYILIVPELHQDDRFFSLEELRPRLRKIKDLEFLKPKT